MRFRAGLVLFIFALLAAVGCRKPLSPNVDRNEPPETWITAAPQDTITERDEDGKPVLRRAGTIPVRFHMYWAGSDRDGAVAGFYYAVVETIPVPPPGLSLPGLPGPKPQDYRFTSKTDTTFIFNVSEFRPDREHAFFIYAVDDKGKADATPARFIFNALDRFPPDPYIFLARATGPIYRMLEDRSIFVKDTTIFVTDSLTLANIAKAPRDTVPASAELTFEWRGEPTIIGAYVTGYKYKLDDPNFISLAADQPRKVYPIGTVSPGIKLFTLKVLDQAGGAKETNRRFQMNWSPDTWFAGPDPNRVPRDPVTGERIIRVTTGWTKSALRAIPELAGTLFSSDSLTRLPADRPQRKTFYEIYKNNIYIRSEGDTVNMNSWVVFHGGGSDLDSPYDVAVQPNEPALSDTQAVVGIAVVVRPGPQNGSPIGMQFAYSTETTPFRSIVPQPVSGLIPVFDGARVDQAPRIAAYVPAVTAGQVFLALRSVDGHGASDRRVTDPRKLILNGSPDNPELRSRAIMFYVDKAPRFDFNRPGFVPRPDTTFFARTNIKFNLFAVDDDPYDLDPGFRPDGPGGPSTTTVLRWTVTLRGKNLAGNDTTIVPPGGFQMSTPALTFNMPDAIVSEDVYAEIELCDCADCEVQQGSGRCVYLTGTNALHFRVPPPPPPATRAVQSSAISGPRPGPDPSTGRSKP